MAINQIKSNQGYLGTKPTFQTQEYTVEGQKIIKIHTVRAHEFKMGDVDDVEIYASQPIWEWQQTEKGKWVMEHAVESPVWHRYNDYVSFGHTIVISAKLRERDYTFYQLKWGNG